MDLIDALQKEIQGVVNELYGVELPLEEIKIQSTKKDFEGTHTLLVFALTRHAKKKPEVIGQELGEKLVATSKLIEKFNVVKGFLNFELKKDVWLQVLADIQVDLGFGTFPKKNRKVMVEYSSPNTNKPLHLGHLRNNFLGYSVAQILQAYGFEVIKANLVNDRGIHICKSMLAYRKFGKGETPESSGVKGDHLIGDYYVKFDKEYKKEINGLVESGMAKEEAEKQAPLILEAQQMLKLWESGDPDTVNLWKTMNGWVYEGFDQTYEKMGVEFDKIYYESDTYLLGKDLVENGLSEGDFFKKEDGSVWVDLTEQGLDNKLLLRGDGTSVYITQDMGTSELKFKDTGADTFIYVVGNEQDYHFKVLFTIMKKLGRSFADTSYHLSYGMVDLPSGKMKSREGTVVDADDLMREMEQTAAHHTQELGKIEGFSEAEAQHLYYVLALGALKYFLLKVDPKKRMLFNPEESIQFQGNTGPFIQYTHARISSILRRAEQLEVKTNVDSYSVLNSLLPVEIELLHSISKYPSIVAEAAEGYAPSVIAQYAFDLAKEYNRFYAEAPIFTNEGADTIAFRVALSQQVARIIRSSMGLLGIEVPERM